MGVLQAVWLFVRGFFAGRAALMAENLGLRQQLIVLQRSGITNHSDHAPIIPAGPTVEPARPLLPVRMTFSLGAGQESMCVRQMCGGQTRWSVTPHSY